MADTEPIIAHGNEAFRIEVRGFDHIPESERNMSLAQVDFLWVGTSVNLLAFALGALTIAAGLSLWMAILACVARLARLRSDRHRLHRHSTRGTAREHLGPGRVRAAQEPA